MRCLARLSFRIADPLRIGISAKVAFPNVGCFRITWHKPTPVPDPVRRSNLKFIRDANKKGNRARGCTSLRFDLARPPAYNDAAHVMGRLVGYDSYNER